MICILSNFLINKFIENKNDTTDSTSREQYGILAGVIGIISNMTLFLVKLTIGLLSSSISILADAFNNFSDCASSIITILGFKLSNKPADSKHVFGHGRIEYISALIVSFVIMSFGLEFLKTSATRILHPTSIKFDFTSFSILLCSIIIKIWLSKFNYTLGNKINSTALKASALDAQNDVYTSICVIFSYISSNFSSLPIDGCIGIIVSLGIIYSGFNISKETITPLLGEAPSKELVDSIINNTMAFDGVIGIHDLIVHNYGANNYIASIHVEMPANLGVIKMHEIADDIEKKIYTSLNVNLIVHTDPVCLDDESRLIAKKEVEDIIFANEDIISMHDFRVVGDNEKKNLIFDIVVSPDKFTTKKEEELLKAWISNCIKEKHPNYSCVITVDKNFI